MAINILLMLAMSTDPERLFSEAKIIITDCGNWLGIEVIQALECIKSWLAIVEAIDNDIKDQDHEVIA